MMEKGETHAFDLWELVTQREILPRSLDGALECLVEKASTLEKWNQGPLVVPWRC